MKVYDKAGRLMGEMDCAPWPDADSIRYIVHKPFRYAADPCDLISYEKPEIHRLDISRFVLPGGRIERAFVLETDRLHHLLRMPEFTPSLNYLTGPYRKQLKDQFGLEFSLFEIVRTGGIIAKVWHRSKLGTVAESVRSSGRFEENKLHALYEVLREAFEWLERQEEKGDRLDNSAKQILNAIPNSVW